MTQFVSDRDLPLLTQEVDPEGRPIVTMENYCKWYGVQILQPDGRVEHVDYDLLCLYADAPDATPPYQMGDHNYRPELLESVAKHLGGVVDPKALAMTRARWAVEIEDEDSDDHPDAYPA